MYTPPQGNAHFYSFFSLQGTCFQCTNRGSGDAFAKAKLQKKQTPYPPAADKRQTAG
jgi:hypothetical protein